MSRVIVCKLGRLGELRKLIDCQTHQLESQTHQLESQTKEMDSQTHQLHNQTHQLGVNSVMPKFQNITFPQLSDFRAIQSRSNLGILKANFGVY